MVLYFFGFMLMLDVGDVFIDGILSCMFCDVWCVYLCVDRFGFVF